MKIYIAGPYSAPTEIEKLGNVSVVMAACLQVFKKGHIPFIPHLTHYVDLFAKVNGIPMEYQDYMRWDDVWLKECDAILVIAESPGVRVEMKEAQKLGLQFFSTVSEIPKLELLKLIIVPNSDSESETVDVYSIEQGRDIVNKRYKESDDFGQVTMKATMMRPDGVFCALFETGSWH